MITCLRRRGTLAVGHRELISRRFRAPSALVVAFSTAALGAGAARLLTTTYLPVLLERIDDEPVVIALVMVVNAVAGFVVPLIVGPWSDRRTTAGLGRRLPFMIGGTVVGAGGLVAASIGNGSYVALALAAALVYTGLNALTTAHRALLAEDIPDARRPAVNSAQELAAVAGGAIAVVIAGALLTPAPAAAFALIAALLGASLIPTLGASRTIERAAAPRASNRGAPASLRGALGRTGAREVLIAQLLWVLAYAAIPTFFVLYAEHTLGLGLGAAGAALLAFGAMTALGEWLGGRTSSARVHRVLRAGVLLLGAGLLAASTMSTAATAALPLAAAALGAGLVTSLGFAYFARFVPAGEAGSYSGVFFAGRGVAAVVALRWPGWPRSWRAATERSSRSAASRCSRSCRSPVPSADSAAPRSRTSRRCESPPSCRCSRRSAPRRSRERRCAVSTSSCWWMTARRPKPRAHSRRSRRTTACGW